MIVYMKMGKELDIKNKIIFYQNITRIVSSLKMITIVNLKKQKQLLNTSQGFFDHIQQTLKYSYQQSLEYTDNHNSTDSHHTHETNFMHIIGKKRIRVISTMTKKPVLNLLIGSSQGICGDYISRLQKLKRVVSGDWTCIGQKLPKFSKNLCYEMFCITFTNEHITKLAILACQYNMIRIFGWSDFHNCHVQEFNISTKLEAFAVIYLCIYKARVVEETKRLMATDQASKNGEDAIIKLSKELNKARQDQITNELNEIINGSESLNSQY